MFLGKGKGGEPAAIGRRGVVKIGGGNVATKGKDKPAVLKKAGK